MYFFVNDYNSICYPEILDALRESMDESNVGYGFDSHSERARDLIKKALGDEDVFIRFIPGGTPANILGLTCGMRQQDSIFSLATGHVKGHEAGSIEATGLKLELIHKDGGKLSVADLKEAMKDFGSEYQSHPKKVYISNTTELGEVYKRKEIEEIYDFCKENDMYLFIDGARIAAALASEKCDYSLADLTKMCDIFYLGGTKAGFLFGEALIIKNDKLKEDFLNLEKQKGAMLAKGFISGIMWERVFEDPEFYLKGSKDAFAMAKKLSQGFEEKGFSLAYPFESNQVFVLMDDKDVERLREFAGFETMGKKDGKNICRFVTTFRTSPGDVEGFLEKL
ncbi:MAG: aminotransferase class I/II-fold pyridoxal phosphate-dependent enzyme [Anaerococcus sp.]|nr:aminotransferase class I/II-fold pyridoxal phosphate-dependent enzyme [Anaerococcus sp.]